MRTDFIKIIGIYPTANNKMYITLPYHNPPNSVSMLSHTFNRVILSYSVSHTTICFVIPGSNFPSII